MSAVKETEEALKVLLSLQRLDGHVDACQKREIEIPKQKSKFEVLRARLKAELKEREESLTKLTLEQKDIESQIQLKQEQIGKYHGQLAMVKKNEEYQALLHEIEQLKKQIGLQEERIIQIMVDSDDAGERLVEDKKRIAEEVKGIDAECAEIDLELAEAVKDRQEMESQREPLLLAADSKLLARYQRIRQSKPGPAIVPLNGEVCGGCHMNERAQIVNEVMAGEKVHACQHCGRLLYFGPSFEEAEVEAENASG